MPNGNAGSNLDAFHSRHSSRPLENSGSLLQEEFGSAEAMEYTPSNTSQNNSIPTQLVTHSNSNLNLSQVKTGMNGAGSSNIGSGMVAMSASESPSPYSLSQVADNQAKYANGSII